jgi:hypothetical protein
MTLETIRSVFGWCALINLALLLLWFLYFAMARDWLYRVHSRWFDIPADRFDAIHYAAMAGFKLGIILLNLVPYFALRIVG